MRICVKGNIVTRCLAVMLVFTFCFSVWSCRHAQTVNKFNPTVHDKGFLNAWIVSVEPADHSVKVAVIDGDMNFIFHTNAEHFEKFHIGFIAPVTVECRKVRSGCDFTKPYTLYVSGQKVQLIRAEKR